MILSLGSTSRRKGCFSQTAVSFMAGRAVNGKCTNTSALSTEIQLNALVADTRNRVVVCGVTAAESQLLQMDVWLELVHNN